MRTTVLLAEQRFTKPIAEVFPFFAEARNLQAITPPWLDFEVLTPAPIVMAAGTLIDYRLRWRWVPLRWRTRIAAWQPPHRFVDEQLRGPYRLWRHEHRFEERDGGTVMFDRVEYAVPGGWLVERLLVTRDVARIFAYRRQVLAELLRSEGRSRPSEPGLDYSPAVSAPASSQLAGDPETRRSSMTQLL